MEKKDQSLQEIITQRSMTPEQAFDEAAKRIKVLFSRYQIG